MSTFCKFNASFRVFILLENHAKSGEITIFISCTGITKYHLESVLKQWTHVVSQSELNHGWLSHSSEGQKFSIRVLPHSKQASLCTLVMLRQSWCASGSDTLFHFCQHVLPAFYLHQHIQLELSSLQWLNQLNLYRSHLQIKSEERDFLCPALLNGFLR